MPILLTILAALRVAVANHTVVERARASILERAYHYIGRTAVRLAALYARWQAGTLPKPRAPRPARPSATRPSRASATQRLPQGRAWLAGIAGHHARGHGSQFFHNLDQPDLQRFFAEVPHAARLVRPLLHAMGWPAPAPLALPPRPVNPRPPRPPKPAPEPARHGKYRRFNPLTYSPGRIPSPLPLSKPA